MIGAPEKFERDLGIIVCVALLLRVVGIGFGLPHIYHQDEPILVNHAMALGTGSWNPHFFIIPSFTICFLFILYAAAFMVGHLMGFFAGKEAFAVAFFRDPSFFYLLGRLTLGAFFGTAAVYAIGRLGKDFFSPRVGLLAAFFLSVCFLHATHSHYIYADIALTLMVTLLCYFVLAAFKKPSVKNYLLAGVFLGLAVSAKYTAAYFLPAILLSYFFIYREESLNIKNLKGLCIAALAAAAAYLMVVPYTILDWPEFSKQVLGQSGAENPVGIFHHLFYSILNGTSLLFLIAAAFGIKPFFTKHRKEAFFFAMMIAVYYAVNIKFSQPFARYMMPILPMLCLWAAFGFEWISEHLKSSPGVKNAVQAAVVLSLVVPTLYMDHLFVKKDTRDECLAWVLKNVPANETIVVDNRHYAPHLRESSQQIKEKYSLLEGLDPIKKKRLDFLQKAQEGMKSYRVFTLSQGKVQEDNAFLFQKPFVGMSLEKFRQIGAKYLILNYSEYHQEIQAFKNAIASHLELKAVFQPYYDPKQKLVLDLYSGTSAPDSQADLFSRKQLGPYLEVYELKP